MVLVLSLVLSHLVANRDDHRFWELPQAGHVSTHDLS
jgi:hypothetical protein